MNQKPPKEDPREYMYAHSLAKIELYTKYLARFFRILARARVDQLFIYDLMCGEGLYKNNKKGSAIAALDCVQSWYENDNEKDKVRISNIYISLNDNGNCYDDKNLKKIDKVKKHAESINLPRNTFSISYTADSYQDALKKALKELQQAKNSKLFTKSLFFIDPYGYKEINTQDLMNILNFASEILLFLPISFMYRFLNSVSETENRGAQPLRTFLQAVFGENIPKSNTPYKFIEDLREGFKQKTGAKYVHSFFLESDSKSDSNGIFCLFFFTNHWKGAEAMIDAKWELDPKHGEGYKKDDDANALELFAPSSFFSDLLEQRIYASDDGMTGHDVFLFGLEHGYLPKHSREILKQLQISGKITIKTTIPKPRKNAFYIQHKDKDGRAEKIIFKKNK